MCGIVGFAISDGSVDMSLVERARDALAHRGPDSAGLWRSGDGRVVLGHRRLAVIDLSPGGHQPMSDPEGRLHIVFNGEIYNFQEIRGELESLGHRFRTQSDTEVLLEAYRAWGVAFLPRLNGMFAFGLYDEVRGSLLLARDRAGEKPLFIQKAAGVFRFASELKALMADPSFARRVDLESLEYYFTFGYVPGNRCILQGVEKLPPGGAIEVDVRSGKLRSWTYWTLPESEGHGSADPEVLVDELQGLLQDSVRRQLVADVPVAVLLSGGVDSSLVTAMAAQVAGRKIRTFTVTFPGHETHDEAPFARLVADHFGTEHVELPAESATPDLLPKLARQFDEPMCDSSMIPTYLLSKMVRQHATVAIGGDGGDELFGGYFHYQWMIQQARLRRWIPSWGRSFLSGLAERVFPLGKRGRNFLLGLRGDPSDAYSKINLFFDPLNRRDLLRPLGSFAGTPPEDYKRGLCEARRGLPGLAMAADFRSYLPEDILVKVDRASMLSSLEVRAPFLDHRIIEFAFGRIPNALRASASERKIVLRRLARRLLPKTLDLDRKQGFSVPMREWFRGEWGRSFEEILRGCDPSIFDGAFIQRLIEGQKRGRSNGERVFSLCLFELWRREYRVSVG